MNPLVTVVEIPGSIEALTDDALASFAVVCLSASDITAHVRMNDRCRKLGVPFISSCSAGLYGFVFLDLLRHEFVMYVHRRVHDPGTQGFKNVIASSLCIK